MRFWARWDRLSRQRQSRSAFLRCGAARPAWHPGERASADPDRGRRARTPSRPEILFQRDGLSQSGDIFRQRKGTECRSIFLHGFAGNFQYSCVRMRCLKCAVQRMDVLLLLTGGKAPVPRKLRFNPSFKRSLFLRNKYRSFCRTITLFNSIGLSLILQAGVGQKRGIPLAIMRPCIQWVENRYSFM